MRRPFRMMPALALSLVVQVSLVFCQYLIALGLRLQIPLSVFFLCVPVSNFFAAIPTNSRALQIRIQSGIDYETFSDGLAVKNVVTISHVYPSGTARATSSAAIEPLAPDFDSLRIVAFHCSAMFCATMRPNTSTTLPTE